MTIIPVNEAKQNLEKVIEQVMNDSEPAVVRTERGDEVVLLSRDEFDSWNETVSLLSTPANAAHLRKSIEEASRGQAEEKELIETSGLPSPNLLGEITCGCKKTIGR